MRFIQVGVGGFGRTWFGLLHKSKKAELVGLVDMSDAALDAACKAGGYGADVLDVEPPPADHVLFSTPNTIITSHVGSRTHESVLRQATMATQNLINFVNGEPPLAQANKV